MASQYEESNVSQLREELNVASVSNAHRNQHPSYVVGQRPIQHPSGDELLVGYHELFTVPIANRRRPDTDARDRARGATDRDHVSNARRPLEQKNQTTDEIRDDLLKTEADNLPRARALSDGTAPPWQESYTHGCGSGTVDLLSPVEARVEAPAQPRASENVLDECLMLNPEC